MKKVITWISTNWVNLLTLIFSLVAIVISYWSYQISKQAIEFDEEKSSFEATPALTEVIDSTHVHFKVNNERSELQALQINFPDSFSTDLIKLSTKPLQINKPYLESLAKTYLKKNLSIQDSMMTVGEFALPVLIDYNVIVYGQSYDLRESRLLLYTFTMADDYSEVKFTNSFLIQRSGFPIKKQFHWKIPWTDLAKDKVIRQDEIDTEAILNEQFRQLIETMKK